MTEAKQFQFEEQPDGTIEVADFVHGWTARLNPSKKLDAIKLELIGRDNEASLVCAFRRQRVNHYEGLIPDQGKRLAAAEAAFYQAIGEKMPDADKPD